MSSSPVAEPPSPSPAGSPPAAPPRQVYTSTPNYSGKRQQPPLNVILPAPCAPATPPAYIPGEPTLTPPPRSPGSAPAGDGRHHPPDGTSSDKSSETAVGGVPRTPSSTTALSRKESYKAQRQHYRREKKRAASALLHNIEDPSVVVLADWLKVRGSLKSWTKLWCVLKPGLLLLYKSSKAKSSHWVGTVLLTSCQVIERPSKKDGFCFKLYHPLEQSIWAPRGPHNETIRAVVQPLPTAHLIFRAPSQPAGHCWLDGLELALRCSNAMLRCPLGERGGGVPTAEEDLEKHFNEHGKRISELRTSGVKTDSEDDIVKYELPKRKVLKNSEVICTTPDNFVITKTAPSIERFRRYSSSSTDEVGDNRPSYRNTPEKFSLIDYSQLPSISHANDCTERRDDRFSSQNIYIAGKVVCELAGAASDSDSEGSRGMAAAERGGSPPAAVTQAVARIQNVYIEDMDREIGDAGELVEEVAEENKSLLWFLLKQVRPGMDLSKVVLPTFILEPRSFLDKLSDNYYHADILGQAAATSDPYERFKTVLRWYLSGLYKKPKGLKKPYNPVLGEIFRCCWKNKNDTYTYYVAEQVSHHPPVSAFYVSNRKDGYVIEGSLLARSKFYGNSTSAILEGCVRLNLLPFGETYITTAPYAHCKGIVIGTLSMELGGKIQIICEQTGYHADVEFKLRSFLGSAESTNAVTGRIKKGRDTVATVDGFWDGRIDIKDKRSGEESVLLDVSQLKEQRLVRYLMKMQHQKEFESQRLWRHVSDAILGDDQVAATEQKTIIEEGQRERARANGAHEWTPRYFRKDPNEQSPLEGIIDQGWLYNHSNMNPWEKEEQFEYEDDFVIASVRGGGGGKASVGAVLLPRDSAAHAPLGVAMASRVSDSDTHDDLARRSKTSTRTLKQSLYAIDTALRDQTKAIERLSQIVENMSEGQRQVVLRPQNMGRVVNTTHTWDMLGGFVLAVVLQALLNWIFYQKD